MPGTAGARGTFCSSRCHGVHTCVPVAMLSAAEAAGSPASGTSAKQKEKKQFFASPSQKQFKFCFLHLLLRQALVGRTELRLQQRVG